MSSINKKAYEYLAECLKYYDDKSKVNKRWYGILIAVDILFSSFIPFATLFIDVIDNAKYYVALMGSIVTAITSFRITFGFHENWIEYRTSAEILKYHKYLYETNSTPYKDGKKDEILISNINAVVTSENKAWRSYQLNKKSIISNQNSEQV